jgi:hypothetical protein
MACAGPAMYPLLNSNTSSIRLIEILPGDGPTITCALKVFDLSTCPDYIALSYVWGHSSPCTKIILNGLEFVIRNNLYQALQALRQMISKAHSDASKMKYLRFERESKLQIHKDRRIPNVSIGVLVSRLPRTWKYIWIDALCIDQSNLPERNHQVKLMSALYSQARHVVAWLGEAKEKSTELSHT